MITEALSAILLTVLLNSAAGQLQTLCTGTDRVFNNISSSCYVLNRTLYRYSQAKISCEDYLGYSGHLIFIRDANALATLAQLLSKNGNVTVYTGYEQTNTTGARNTSWTYGNKNGTNTPATYVPWATNEPQTSMATRAVYIPSQKGVNDVVGESNSYNFVCEYENSLQQPVTSLETVCHGLNKSVYHLYANGICYTMNQYSYSGYSAILSCKEAPGIRGHLIHIRSYADLQIAGTLINAASTGSQYVWVGIQKLNSTFNASTPGVWYYTMPSGPETMATYLPWATGYPSTSTATGNIVLTWQGNGVGFYYDSSPTSSARYICEYEPNRTMTTALELSCSAVRTSYITLFANGNCYVLHPQSVSFQQAQLSCKDIFGYDGHLIHIRNGTDLNIMTLLIGANNGWSAWVGLELTNITGPLTGTWSYVTPSSNTEIATYIPWNPGYPANGYGYTAYFGSNGLGNWPSSGTVPFVCQYEQANAHPVTYLEIFCNSTSFKGWYYNGSCMANAANATANDISQRAKCPSDPNLASHFAHLNTQAKWTMAKTLGRRDSDAGMGTYRTYIGLEQLKACPKNKCSEEPDKAWFWTTPEGYKWAVDMWDNNTYWQWSSPSPNDVNSELNYAYFTENGLLEENGAIRGTVTCEWELPYNFTPAQKVCLQSPNPSAYINSTCYTLNRNLSTYATAATQCTEFASGHLVSITSSSVAQFLRYQLWGNHGLSTNTNLFTGLYQDASATQWNFVMVEGTELPAVSPPWSPGEPNDANGNCASFNQSGALFVSDCTQSQWFICQYDCEMSSLWSSWSACSQTCDNGVQYRQQTAYNITATCANLGPPGPPSTVTEYQSCSSGTPCRGSSSRTTALQTQCASLSGYYAYSTCYFIATPTTAVDETDAATYCTSQGGQLAALFAPDLVSQIGSVLLQSNNSIEAWVNLQYTGGNLRWIANNSQFSLFDNTTTTPTQNCFALVSTKMTWGNGTQLPQLMPTNCAITLSQALCMINDVIYSSYFATEGTKVTESQSPEPISTAFDANDCGSRCGELVSCLGFNFKPSDGSCIPTKVSLRTPTTINGVQILTIQSDSAWTFYDRI